MILLTEAVLTELDALYSRFLTAGVCWIGIYTVYITVGCQDKRCAVTVCVEKNVCLMRQISAIF